MISLELKKLLLKIQSPLFILFLLLWIDVLDPFYLLLPNLVLSINSTKESWIDTMVAKMAMKHNTPLLQREAYPILKGVWIKKIFKMFRREEPHSIAFPNWKSFQVLLFLSRHHFFFLHLIKSLDD